MPQSLNVIALVSGGKDSFFSLLHCLKNGHNVIALANLYPPAASHNADLNSYMYQTVGHTVIPLYSDALRLPLYRQQISGSAVNAAKDYAPNTAASYGDRDDTASNGPDETESLLHLLQEVMVAHPGANAVSSGAILSTYQRTRIESVALRLGLTPLSYLWQYPILPTPIPRPGGLLEDMAAVGIDARIVKVASGGLDERLLWASLQDEKVRRKIEKDAARFGGSVLGEGGEYETLAVRGPSPVWKKCLEINEEARQIVQEGGGEYWIAFREGQLISISNSQSDEDWMRRLNVPHLYDRDFKKLLHHPDIVTSIAPEPEKPLSKRPKPSQPWAARTVIFRSSNLLTISNLCHSGNDENIKEQMLSIKKLLETALENHSSSVDQIVFTTLLLRSMQDFAVVNSVYASLFSKPNPPARVTVACGDAMPLGVEVMASFTVDQGPREARHGLHIQSRSYWAPSNIGPYSQAIAVPILRLEQSTHEQGYLVYIAGQIPLVPASMEVLSGSDDNGQSSIECDLKSFWRQTCLSLQHLWRVGRATGVNWWVNAIVFIVGDDHIQAKGRLAHQAWKLLHERNLWEDDMNTENDNLDIWDQRYGFQSSLVTVSDLRIVQEATLTLILLSDPAGSSSSGF